MSPSLRALSARLLELSLILLLACSPYRDLAVTDTKSFADSKLARIYQGVAEGQVHRAEVEIYGRYFTGLLVIKAHAAREYRVVFMSEMGVKFFDLLFKKDSFELKHCMDKLDRKVVMSRIRKDLRLLLMPSIEDEQEGKCLERKPGSIWKFDGGKDGTFYYHLRNEQLEKGELVDGMMKKKKVVMRLSWKKSEELPEQIVFEHQNIELQWRLKQVREQ